MKSTIDQQANRFLDWLCCKKFIWEWLFFFFGIPALLLLVIGILAFALSGAYMLFGLL